MVRVLIAPPITHRTAEISPGRPQIPTYWRLPARSTWSLDSRTLPRRTLWLFCLCTLKSLFPGNGDRLDLRLVRGWEAGRRFRRYASRWLVERFFAWLQRQRRILVRWEYYPPELPWLRPTRLPRHPLEAILSTFAQIRSQLWIGSA
jgi:hypothetical protein